MHVYKSIQNVIQDNIWQTIIETEVACVRGKMEDLIFILYTLVLFQFLTMAIQHFKNNKLLFE